MQQRLVAEIIGPAGAGKSTLAQTLRQHDPTIRTGLSVWGLPSSLLLLSAFSSLPTLPGLLRRRSCRADFGLVVRLNALHRLLERERSGGKTLLMDEGAIFALVKLHAFGLEGVASRRVEKWTKSVMDRWAETLDTVIWLDAPDAVLTKRIRERHKGHRMKEQSDAEIHRFLARYRRSYEQIITELSARRNLKIIRLSTQEHSLERIAEESLSSINGERRAHVVG